VRSGETFGGSHAFGTAREAWWTITAKRIYARHKADTMIPRKSFAANLVLMRRLAPTRGAIVECGVWRGGMSAGMADMLPGRNHYLFDSFEGLPPARDVDGAGALAYQRNPDAPTYLDNCRAEKAFAEAAMRRSRAARYQVVKGWFNETLPSVQFAEPIAILRLDGDWYESTLICLQYLFPKVAQGGLVVIDDYNTWDGCARAVHDYLATNKLAERIRQTPRKIFYIHKSTDGGTSPISIARDPSNLSVPPA